MYCTSASGYVGLTGAEPAPEAPLALCSPLWVLLHAWLLSQTSSSLLTVSTLSIHDWAAARGQMSPTWNSASPFVIAVPDDWCVCVCVTVREREREIGQERGIWEYARGGWRTFLCEWLIFWRSLRGSGVGWGQISSACRYKNSHYSMGNHSVPLGHTTSVLDSARNACQGNRVGGIFMATSWDHVQGTC